MDSARACIASIFLVGSVMVAAPGWCRAEASNASAAQLELQANMAFNRGQYDMALPLLTKLRDLYASEPERLGPIKERIRVCEKALASLKNTVAVKPIDEPTSAKTRRIHALPKAGEVLELTIKGLGNFDYDQEHGGNIPADVKILNGSKIRVRGFMIPVDQVENITQFALVPGLNCCQFGQAPQVQHTIIVTCPKGKAVGYCPDEIIVEGSLKVQEKKDDGYIVSIFEMDVTSVKPAPK